MKLFNLAFQIGIMVIFCFMGEARSDNLGRLFTTAKERAALDSNSGIVLAGQNKGINETTQRLKLSGTIISSTGKRTIWIDGKSLGQGKETGETQARILKNGKVYLETPDNPQGSILQPGQILNLSDGQVYESFILENTDNAVESSVK